MPIHTERLLLRPCVPEDITDVYVNALNDPEVVGLTEARHKKWMREDVEKYIRASNMPGESELIGIFLQSGKHIGNVRLFNFHPVHKRVELGMIIFDKTEWNKGYVTEALHAIEQYIFDTLALHRIQADYYATNNASAAVFKKAGFTIEGIFKEYFFTKNGYIDSIRIAKINPNI